MISIVTPSVRGVTGISCKFEGKTSLDYNAFPSLNFDPIGEVQIVEAIVFNFTPIYNFIILAFSYINLSSVHKG